MSLKNFLLLITLSLAVTVGYAQHDGHDDKPTHQEEVTHDDHQQDGHEKPTHDGKSEEGQKAHPEGDEGNDATEEDEKISDIIIHHIIDNHNWHITDLPGGGEIALHFPWIVYSNKTGLVFTSDAESLVEKGMVAVHEKPYVLKDGAASHIHLDHHTGQAHMDKKQMAEYIDQDAFVINLSITKTVFQMLLIGFILVLVMVSVARAYTKREGEAPKGLQSFMEPIIMFVRDEIARPYLGEKANRFLPYLLTLFFFIWFANLFGLMPFNSNIAGNISFTAALAILTFLITQFNASKDHWIHVFNTPGVPWWLKFGVPLMPIVEVIGLISKPFALAVRLFANITAGHFMVLGLICLIFILGQGGNYAGGFGIAPLSVGFTIIIFCLEMIVAIIQPFIFTLLTAVFVGMAMETHDDHH
ncbi:MAG: F0F1 ATP synthase subunit A [Bacteroidota bacterium]